MPSQETSEPHHHSRTEQFEWVEIGFNARLDAEPAPAREPSAVEEVIQELREQYFCGTLVQRVERVIRQQQEELDRLRLQLISASEAEEDAKRLRAENAALREKLAAESVCSRAVYFCYACDAVPPLGKCIKGLAQP